MKILAIDDKERPRKVLVRGIEGASPEAEVVACANADEVLTRTDVDTFDVAFIDIDMPGMNGIELARKLKSRNLHINVVFATGYDEYMADAFAMHSSGYLMKPITQEAIASELENLRFPTDPATANADKLVIHCFGNFEVFADGKPVSFGRAKSKEMLAFLVDRRGAIVNQHEIETILWDDVAEGMQKSGSYLRTLVADLRRSLAACGHDDVLIKRYGQLGIDASKISCDYYAFLEGDPRAINTWRGEYMTQYSWAEPTKAALLR